MAAIPYTGDVENPGGAAPYEGEVEPLEKGPSYAQRAWEGAKAPVSAALAGAGAGLGFYFGRGLLRRSFPGMMPKTSAMKELDAAIKLGDKTSGLKPMWGKYLHEIVTTDKPLTFADFMSQQPGHHEAVGAIRRMLGNSGMTAPIEESLLVRSAGARQRVLSDIAQAMGINPQSMSEGLEKLKASKMARAAPLYEEAFKNTNPIRDTKMLDLFGTDTPNMSMMNALKGRIKTLALQGKEPPSLLAAEPDRRDAWKRLTTAEVPEHLFTGKEPWSKLREYYAPAVEDLHHMRGNLWDEYTKAKKVGDNEAAKAYLDSWKNVTNYLDEHTSGAYKKAREAYKGDSDLESAFQTGADLLSMKPDEVRQSIKGMGSDERQALASGFYGGLQDMNQQEMLRKFVRRPELFPEKRELLSTVFRDPQRLNDFIQHLSGEQAMTDAAHAYSHAPPSKDPMPRVPFGRIYDPISSPISGLHASIIENIKPNQLRRQPAWTSPWASSRGTDISFREPQLSPLQHPDTAAIYGEDLSRREIAKRLGEYTSGGGLGGLGLYGLSQMPGWGGEEMQGQ